MEKQCLRPGGSGIGGLEALHQPLSLFVSFAVKWADD